MCDKKIRRGNETRIETEAVRSEREKLIQAFKEPRGCSTAFRTRRRNGLPPRRNGKTNPLSAPSFAFRLCAYITFDPHLCKPSPPFSARGTRRRRRRHLLRYHRSYASQPPARTPPFVLDPLNPDVFGTSSVPEPDPAKLCSMFAAGGNPQEFHFVCEANYTPGFYIRGCRYFTMGQRGEWFSRYALFVSPCLRKNHYDQRCARIVCTKECN